MVHAGTVRHHDPAMAPRLIDRAARRAEAGIGESADGDRDEIGIGVDLPVDRRAADRTEIERHGAAFIALALIDGTLAFHAHLRVGVARLGAEHAAGAALAFQAVADGNAHRLALAGDAELAATAGGMTGGHGHDLSISCLLRTFPETG